MAGSSFLGRVFLQSPSSSAVFRCARALSSKYHELRTHYATSATSNTLMEGETDKKKERKWLTLPPFTPTVDGSALGKELSGRRSTEIPSTMTALNWVTKCCPQLPRSLVQKLFRLRQVRRESFKISSSDAGIQTQECQVKRVAAKDFMECGDRIFLPNTVQEFPSQKSEPHCIEDEQKFVHSLELYKDSAIIVINKPPGMPVQGGIGVSRSLDELAGTYLRHDYSESPRLVHRLDRDSSGILIMGRTQLSATVLHSIFREKTFGASGEDQEGEKRVLQRKYWALVIGSPRRPHGIISVPLGKVVVDGGKSERITVVGSVQNMPSQHAITEYRVVGSSCYGYTWLELCPRTGRKHQLRVHCAEVMGTPIVGDYKYGWQAHRKHIPFSDLEHNVDKKLTTEKTIIPFGLDLDRGSISEKEPQLHLHCKEMSLPDVSVAIDRAQRLSDCNLTNIESLKLDAPLPYHMQRSWDILNS